jgi:hypothetical protein
MGRGYCLGNGVFWQGLVLPAGGSFVGWRPALALCPLRGRWALRARPSGGSPVS